MRCRDLQRISVADDAGRVARIAGEVPGLCAGALPDDARLAQAREALVRHAVAVLVDRVAAELEVGAERDRVAHHRPVRDADRRALAAARAQATQNASRDACPYPSVTR